MVFAGELKHCYRRDTVRILANLVPATQGEARSEAMGGGDASQPRRRFTLKQGPLTFVPAPTPSGAASTLEVLVDEVPWRETQPGEEPKPADRVYRVEQIEDGGRLVVFGDGARPRTGSENVAARYRVGIGSGGNVAVGRITTLVTRPLGVKAVVNPVEASGAAGPDDAADIRERAPIATEALDRLVGLDDYSSFALAYAGVAKADAVMLSLHGRETVVVSVAARDDTPIESDSEPLRRLAEALRRFGDPLVPVAVVARTRLPFVLDAGARLVPGRHWSDVEPVIRRRLLDAFAPSRRSLGQDLALADVIAVIQSTPGSSMSTSTISVASTRPMAR